ncbi:aminoglycoside phosphotransferase family protein [Streptomyces chilikensis]|uniref:aminoglycoside phosphotransferase family protein n=1 Tax=Streptomyces chilikensis TaxID=1194079 RepID=UPI00140A7C96|nr:aminoglycoside phosphotransferase family protein [Streptomyces chilikensis]
MPADLHAHARAAAHPAAPCPGCATGTLADRPDATVVRHHRTVAKAHAPGTAPEELRRRLAVAAALPEILLPPLTPAPTALDGRQVTCWPLGLPVDPRDPGAAPWEDAATLTARLHRTPPPPGLPAMRGPRKAALAVARLAAEAPGHPAAPVLLRAWAALPPWARAEEPAPPELGAALCHGDLHLGQLVRHPAPDGPWRLIDVDDLGVGVPAWDLARPASWFACGLLPAEEWQRFLGAYRAARGPALPADGDPWPVLDVPARALTVQTASRSVTKALLAGRPLDGAEEALVDACGRMTAPRTGVL